MERMLCKVGFWFLRRGGWNLEILDLLTSIPSIEVKLIERAKGLTKLADKLAEGTSGEYKRHHVYAQMIKDFPAMTKRQIAMAIEIGLG